MKTLDAATIRNIAETIASTTMLAIMATLCICFISIYMAASVWFQILSVVPFLNCIYSRKRIAYRNTRERKFALFTKNPNSRAGLFGIT